MAKRARELSALEIRRLAHAVSADGKPYNALHAVGGVPGLLLQVTPDTGKSWILRTVVGGKRRNIGLGSFPAVGVAEARRKAQEAKDLIAHGIDPVEQRKAHKRALLASQLSAITFDDAAKQYIESKAAGFRNPRQAQQWKNSLATYASPTIGSMPVNEIELPHIKAILDPIWTTKNETASRVRARIEKILGWCAVHGYRSNENPARWGGYLDEVYPAPSNIAKPKHHAALPVEAMPEFMASLRKRNGMAATALEFLILTASRTNEVIGDKRIGKRGITWAEIDLSRKIWTVPPERMKSGKEHIVPLCSRAVTVLKALPRGDDDGQLFGSGDAIPSNNFLSSLLKRMDANGTVHGFRSTFKDWARQHTSYDDEVSELALAHVNNDATRAAYARDKLVDKRRLLMNDWQRFCDHGPAKGSNVRRLHA